MPFRFSFKCIRALYRSKGGGFLMHSSSKLRFDKIVSTKYEVKNIRVIKSSFQANRHMK